jgi:predicted RNA-binding protein with PUA-like domain
LVNRRGQRLSVMPVTPEEWKIVSKAAKDGK